MRTAEQARKELEELRKRTQIICAVHAVIYALAITLAAVGQYAAGAALTGANLLAYVLFLRRRIGAYSESAARENILFGLCAPLEEARYTGRVGPGAEEFQSLALLPIKEGKDALLVRAAFSGQSYGLELGGCEFTLHYTAPGAKDKTRYQFLSGTLLTARPQNSAWAGNWLLLRCGLLDEAVQQIFLEQQGYAPAACSQEKLSDRFQIYAGDGAGELPRWLARRVERLAEQSERLGAVRLTEKRAAVYLENRFYTGRTKIRDLPNEKWLTHCPLPERDAVWDLFRNLNAAEE